jgi:hypothetical protein
MLLSSLRLPALLLVAGSLVGCFSGSAQNPAYQYQESTASQTKYFLLTFYTATLNDQQSDGNGTITITYNGTTVSANEFPTTLLIPEYAIVTVTAAPAGTTTTVTWDGLTPGTNPLSCTFVMSSNLTFGCTFTNSANG